MLNMNAGALRQVMDKARAGNLMDATALIQETLGQHGLASTGTPNVAMPNLRQPQSGTRSDRETYRCAAGSREYLLHLPNGKAQGLLLMLHGCTQTPEDFAVGTHIVPAAHALGIAVLLPAQSRGDNAQSCWNWFSGADQRRGKGEPEILAGLTAQIAQQHAIAAEQTYVAGLSAGGAMAVILGETYPDRFAGVGVHSGLPYGCARSVNEAFAAMGGKATRQSRTHSDKTLPTIVFHGNNDATVKPSNGAQIIGDTLDRAAGAQTQIITEEHTNGRSFIQTTTLDAQGGTLTEYWQINGLGHAWSGGNAKGSHTDPKGPDASAEMLRFFTSLHQKAV